MLRGVLAISGIVGRWETACQVLLALGLGAKSRLTYRSKTGRPLLSYQYWSTSLENASIAAVAAAVIVVVVVVLVAVAAVVVVEWYCL